MNPFKKWGYLLAAVAIIILVFIIASIFDIVIAVVNSRFYSTAAFIVVFGVGGIFAGILAYGQSTVIAPVKNEFTRWSLISMIILTGLAFIFPLAVIEGGEYEAAFRSFGITLALSTIIFMKEKIEF